MRGGVLAAVALSLVGAVAWGADLAKPREQFTEAESKARKAYNSAVSKAGADLKQDLEREQVAATKAGKLDEAVAIKKELDTIGSRLPLLILRLLLISR